MFYVNKLISVIDLLYLLDVYILYFPIFIFILILRIVISTTICENVPYEEYLVIYLSKFRAKRAGSHFD